MIEYQFWGLHHAHIIVCLSDVPDVQDDSQGELISFVNRYFIAEMPHFEGDLNQNIFDQEEGSPAYTEAYKCKAVESVRTNNKHQCSTAINGRKKNEGSKCKRGYSRKETIPETYVDEVLNRVVYQRRTGDDLLIVPYNLAMMMDWDSHLNVEYSGSVYCALYLYKYCYKGSLKREQIALDSEKEQDSLDEIKLFMYGRIMSSMSAMWRLYGYQDYLASEPPVVAFKVCTLEQLKDFIRQCEVTDLLIYYGRREQLKNLKYTEFFQLPQFYSNNPQAENEMSLH